MAVKLVQADNVSRSALGYASEKKMLHAPEWAMRTRRAPVCAQFMRVDSKAFVCTNVPRLGCMNVVYGLAGAGSTGSIGSSLGAGTVTVGGRTVCTCVGRTVPLVARTMLSGSSGEVRSVGSRRRES